MTIRTCSSPLEGERRGETRIKQRGERERTRRLEREGNNSVLGRDGSERGERARARAKDREGKRDGYIEKGGKIARERENEKMRE